MEETRRIAEQLKLAFEGDPWHGPSLQEILKDISAEIAYRKPTINVHNIWELILHITTWLSATRKYLKGETVAVTPEEDFPLIQDVDENSWENGKNSMFKIYRELYDEINMIEQINFEDLVPGKNYSFYTLLSGVIQHSVYHAGQIAALKKIIV